MPDAPIDPRTPVLVGLGELVRRPAAGDVELTEPAAMMVGAIDAALADATGHGPADPASSALLSRVGAIAVAPPAAWPDGAPASRVAALLGPRIGDVAALRGSLQGGNGPQVLVNRIATDIASGAIDAGIVCGAEALAGAMHAQKAGSDPGWPAADPARTGDEVVEGERDPASPDEVEVGLVLPTTVYPLIEDAVRRDAGRTIAQQLAVSAGLWSRFSAVAATQPAAWSPEPRTAEELATPTPRNRRISLSYPKLLNANIAVDQAAALVLCSAALADELGIPADRRTYVHAGAQATEVWNVSARPELHRSPAIAAAVGAALDHAGVAAADLGPVDLYSCFPCAVQVAAREIGLPLDDPDRPLTATGGLTFFGGPGNDYATHGIIAVARALRDEPAGAVGLSTALGWYATKHAAGIYGNRPPERPFAALTPTVDAEPVQVAPVGRHEGTAELRSVLYDRDGAPYAGTAFVRLPDGRRALAKASAPEVLAAMEDDAFPDRPVTVGEDRELALGHR